MTTIITHASQTSGISSAELFRIAANNAAYAMTLYRGLKADAVKQSEAGDHTTAFWSRTAAVKEQFRAYAIMGAFRSAIGNRTQRELEEASIMVEEGPLDFTIIVDDRLCDMCDRMEAHHIQIGHSEALICPKGRQFYQLARAICALPSDSPVLPAREVMARIARRK